MKKLKVELSNGMIAIEKVSKKYGDAISHEDCRKHLNTKYGEKRWNGYIELK